MARELFLSRDKAYKSHFGAAPAGAEMHFRICLPRELSCSAAALLVRDDLAGREHTAGLFWCGLDDDPAFEWWECHFRFDSASLYFFHFELETPQGKKFLRRGWGGVAELRAAELRDDDPDPDDGDEWQQTVYAPDFETPGWLSGGLIYQIFPDSFCVGASGKKDVPAGRVIQPWGEEPHWRPDADGEIRNDHYYGGDLEGIISKLDYLKRLGVTCIYLNPIFEAHENHRYNTADYEKIDPMLGDESTFRKLCAGAKKRGMRIILDGVFSHTGDDSVYFNRRGRYASVGAHNSVESPYYSWYTFEKWPDKYTAWWDIKTLPELRETSPGVLAYFTGGGGVAARWIKAGAAGWRLDVADELPDGFLDALRVAVKSAGKDALILGEVWEDASNKVAYGQRRRYFLGGQLDTVMNYPFKDAILAYLTGTDGEVLIETVMTILENYPPQVVPLLMNLVGTHDTPRAINVLGGADDDGRSREWRAAHPITPEQYETGWERLKLAALLQYTLPGVPSLYYGDEVGLTGHSDPFNRASFPWPSGENGGDDIASRPSGENCVLLGHYRNLGALRRDVHCLKDGEFIPGYTRGRVVSFTRRDDADKIFVAVNAGDEAAEIPRPDGFGKGFPWLRDEGRLPEYTCTDEAFTIPAGGFLVYYSKS